MSFNSPTFLCFLLLVFFAHWAVASRPLLRFSLLFAASCAFYMSWNAKLIGLILFSTALDFYVGGAIARSERDGVRRALLAVSLVGNLGLLGFFKYFNFFAESAHAMVRATGLGGAVEFVPWDIVLPLGISFYTFQSLSYTIDVYRRKIEPSRSLLEFALYVAFFPQLVAGPIVRAKHFLPQLRQPARYDDARTSRAVFLIALGFVKKVLLADTIGIELVDPVFASPESFSPLEIWTACCGAIFQVYLDFSAYSDIAIGCAACLGFSLPANFDRPFLAQSLTELITRWHISMTTWFRDYVFVALSGTRIGRRHVGVCVLATLLLSGLWHGAGWNYLLWAGGLALVVLFEQLVLPTATLRERAARRLPARLWRRALTFAFVALSMVPFRNGTEALGQRGVDGTLDMLACLVRFSTESSGLDRTGLLALAVAALVHFTPKRWVESSGERWLQLPSPAQALALVALTGALAAVAYEKAPFIYFQF